MQRTIATTLLTLTAATIPALAQVNPTQDAYLKAPFTDNNDRFGQAVAISGNTAVVGILNDDSAATTIDGNAEDNSAQDSGAAIVFERGSDGTWVQQAYLKAFNAEEDDWFGRAVAIDGDTIVVGAPHESSGAVGVNGNQNDNSEYRSGAAYVFVRNGDSWTQQAYLKASNSQLFDRFGWSVAVAGDTIAVGAFAEGSAATGVDGDQDDDSALSSGAAYVFVRGDGMWGQQAYLKASNTQAGDYFGRAIAIDGDSIVVTAIQEDSDANGVDGNQNNNVAEDAGAAYVFTRTGVTWSQQAYLKASNSGSGDWFGLSVDIDGDTVIVGAPEEDSNATGIDGNQNNNSADATGAAYVFRRSSGTWSQESYLKASNSEAGDEFGQSVAIDGGVALVSAHLEDSDAIGIDGDQADNSLPNNGATYVFTHDGSWSQTVYLKSPSAGQSDQFGFAVGLDGEFALVSYFCDSNATGVDGDPSNNDVNGSGAAVVFDLDLYPCDTAASQTEYGVGHPGTLGVPSLTLSAPPVLGTTVELQLGNSAGAPAAAGLFLGPSEVSLPTPFGGTLLVNVAAVLSLNSLPLLGLNIEAAIPNDPGMCGVALYYQLVQIDPGASHGIAFSRGLRVEHGM